MKTAFLVVALTATALADPKDDRARAEELERDAKVSGSPEAFATAGTAYLALYNADPKAAGGDELLYNAAVAFESSRSISAAIQAFTLLRREYPRSQLAARALARLARIYGDVAMFDKAAEALEQYAKQYAGEKDALDAYSDAVYYRKALGDRDKAIEGTKYVVRTWSAKRPQQAADAMWSLTAIYEAANDPDTVVKHLREYLKMFGTKGGAGRVVIANAKIGQLLWKESCPLHMVDGLCVTTAETARTCGTGTAVAITPAKRDDVKLKAALAAFAAASREFQRNQAFDDPAARYYYAQAQLAVADAELEPYFADVLPRDLSFDPAKRTDSQQRFVEWLEHKQRVGESVTRKYEAVLATKDPASSITAANRLGFVAYSFASTLVGSPLPRDVHKSPDKRAAYCAALDEAAQPLDARALEAFRVCLTKSTELAWFDESSRVCERELARLRPAEFPLAREVRAQPADFAPIIVSEPPVKR